jgi:hypothetical protein
MQTEITSKSLAVLAIESSSLTAELKLKSCLVGWVDEFVVMVRMVEIRHHLVIKCQVCTLHGDVRWDGRVEMGKVHLILNWMWENSYVTYLIKSYLS